MTRTVRGVNRVERFGKDQATRGARSGVRAKSAASAIGPVGYVFNSPATARVLGVFAREPKRRFALRDILGGARGAKGTVQSALRSLEKAQLVRREGSGSRTTYHFDMEGAVGRAMLKVIEVSQASGAPAVPTIPWLSDYARQPGGGIASFHGDRSEREVSDEETENILQSAETVEGATTPRLRPGLATRESS